VPGVRRVEHFDKAHSRIRRALTGACNDTLQVLLATVEWRDFALVSAITARGEALLGVHKEDSHEKACVFKGRASTKRRGRCKSQTSPDAASREPSRRRGVSLNSSTISAARVSATPADLLTAAAQFQMAADGLDRGTPLQTACATAADKLFETGG
jgi:hypothetical protein